MTDTINKLAVCGTLKDGCLTGIKNICPILVNVLFWFLTFWIPYINVGTTIGFSVGIVSKLSRGEAISMFEIFNPQYRKNMGEYFLTYGLVCLGAAFACIFFLVPGIIIGIAWSLSVLLAIDKGKSPMEAISLSNKLTYGNKWRIFGIYIGPMILYFILVTLITVYLSPVNMVLGLILTFIVAMIFIMIMYGILSNIYKQLAQNVN